MSWFSRKNPRALFPYYDGKRQREADPMVVLRKMSAHEKFDAKQHLVDISNTENEAIQAEAQQICVEATRDIFGIEAWSEDNPNGMTETETLGVLLQFTLFIDALKKNGSGLLT